MTRTMKPNAFVQSLIDAIEPDEVLGPLVRQDLTAEEYAALVKGLRQKGEAQKWQAQHCAQRKNAR